jgi:hypothetical protein
MVRKGWLLAALVALVGAAAQASTFLAMSREELVAGSAAVVDGRVTQVRSFWNAEHTAILTEALVRVDDVVVGDAPMFVKVRTFGGTVGRVRIEAAGFPTFTAGERQLLFLYREPADGSVRVQGYQLGQYRIQTGAEGADVAIPMADAGMRLVRADRKSFALPRTERLEDLKTSVREDAERLGRRVP